MEGTHHFCPARQGGQELLHQSCDLVLAQTSRDPLIENLALVPPILRSPGELEKAQLWPPFELGGVPGLGHRAYPMDSTRKPWYGPQKPRRP